MCVLRAQYIIICRFITSLQTFKRFVVHFPVAREHCESTTRNAAHTQPILLTQTQQSNKCTLREIRIIQYSRLDGNRIKHGEVSRDRHLTKQKRRLCTIALSEGGGIR